MHHKILPASGIRKWFCHVRERRHIRRRFFFYMRDSRNPGRGAIEKAFRDYGRDQDIAAALCNRRCGSDEVNRVCTLQTPVNEDI
jgi:hypothetical protein